MRIANSLTQKVLCSLAMVLISGSVASSAESNDIRKFDIGPKGQLVFPGFTEVGPNTMYSKETGYGWTEAPGHFGVYRMPGFPDTLVCDFAAPTNNNGWGGGYPGSFAFRLDVAPGEYEVSVISGDYFKRHGGELQYNNMITNYTIRTKFEEITANGKTNYHNDFNAEQLTKEFYHDMNTIERRGMTVWDRLLEWRFPTHTFRAEAPDGQLLLQFKNMPVNAIIVYPVAKEAEGNAFLKELLEARKKSCPLHDMTPKPEGKIQDFLAEMASRGLLKEAEKNGYFLFVPHYSETVYTDAIPKEEWIKDEITSFASLGEYESFTFSVFPLKDMEECEVTVSDLKSKSGAVISGDKVDIRVLRYYEVVPGLYGTVANFTTSPYIPMKWNKIPIDQGINRTYWLTIKVPEDARGGIYNGTVKFQPKNAPASELKLVFRVLPFRLKPLSDRFHGLWHDYPNYPGGGIDLTVQNQARIGFNAIHAAGWMQVTYTNGVLGPLDMSDWGKKLDIYRRNGFPMLLVISQGALSAAYRATKEPSVDGVATWADAHQIKTNFSLAFEDCYKKLAKGIDDEFKKRGWPELIYYEVGEAACEGEQGIQTEEHFMRLLKEAGVKNTTSISGDERWIQQSLKRSVPYMYLAMINTFDEEKKKVIEAAGAKIALYGPGENRFERGLYFWRTGAVLCGEEGGVIINGNPYDGFNGKIAMWGDMFPSPDGPINSVKTLSKREGIDDYKYLRHLEYLIQQANQNQSEKQKQLAAGAQKVLDDIRQSVNASIRYYSENVEPPPGKTLDLIRFKVANEIIKLEEEMSKK